MPELPEVEVTRLSFVDRIQGAWVQGVRLGKPLRWPLSCEEKSLTGRRILGVRRRGKYLLIDLNQGLLLVHLGMSGSLRFESALDAPTVHDHFDLITNLGTLRLHDPRRFGAVVYSEGEQGHMAQKLLSSLGVEPLEGHFEAEGFYKALRDKKASIKQILLGGQLVVGVGNIYASEALFLAGIRPTLRGASLSKARVIKLHGAIIQVLKRALQLGGSSLKDFSNARGESGYFQLETYVYDRQSEPCRVCQTPIKMIRQGQRSTFYCPQCQKR
jgi:formamidopyrimidine-DNA glycosylase